MKFKFSSLLVLLIALPFGLTACQNSDKQNQEYFEEDMGDLEGETYDWYYEPSYSDPIDTFMSIDGVLDEPVWNSRHWLDHSDKGVKLHYTTYFTKYGLYVGAIAEDTHIQWNSRFYFPSNSSFWFEVKKKDTEVLHATDVYNFFIDQKNSASRNLARYQAKGYTYYDDEGNPEKLTAELFVSWKALNMPLGPNELYPDYIRINPHYRYIENLSSADNGWIRPLFFFDDASRQICSGRFDKDGYVAYEREGVVLGNAGNGFSKSDGWNLDALDNDAIVSCGPHSQAIFFKDICATHYIFETQMQIIGGIMDTYPSAGVCNMKDEIRFDTFHIIGVDVINGNSAYSAHHLSLYKNGGAGWVDKTLYSIPNNGSKVITLKIIKDDVTFHYIVDDVYYGSEVINYLNGNTCPGLYTLGCEAMFFNFQAKAYDDDLDGLEEELMKYVCPVEVSYSEGGYAYANPVAVVYGQNATITLEPESGFGVSEFKVKTESGAVLYDYDYYLNNVVDGNVSILNVQNKLYVEVEFAQITGSKTRIIGTMVNEKDDSPIANVSFAFIGHDPRLFFSGTTGNTGGLQIQLPKPGAVTVGDHSFTCDGIYDVYLTRDGTMIYADTITLQEDSPNTMRDVIIRAPDIKLNRNMTKHLEGAQYVYENGATVFKQSAYEYTGTFANEAVFSVEVRSGSSITAPGTWNYYLGIIMTQGEMLDPSVKNIKDALPDGRYTYRPCDNPGNEYVGVHVGILQTGFGSSIGTIYTNFKTIQCQSLIGDTNPHTRLVTVVLHNNRFYYYLDNNYLGSYAIDSENYKWNVTNQDEQSFSYEFKENLPVMFGVNATNVENPGIQFRIMTQLYGQDAIDEINNNSIYSDARQEGHIMNRKLIFLSFLFVTLTSCNRTFNGVKNENRLIKDFDSLSEMDFVMEEGARIDERGGMKYRSFLAKADYDEMLEKGYYDISFGMVYTPVTNRQLVGDLTLENIFSSQAVYTTNPNDNTKVLLKEVKASYKLEYHRLLLESSILDLPINDYDTEYMVTMYIKAYRFGMVSYAVTEQFDNDFSYVYLAQKSRDNIALTRAQKEVIENVVSAYKENKGGHPMVNYYVSIYKDGVFDHKEMREGEFDTVINHTPSQITDMSVQGSRSHLSSIIYANERTNIEVYYLSNPEYSIVYYTPDTNDVYVKSYEITGLNAKMYALITLTEEQIALPEGTVYGDESIKDQLVLSTTDSVLSGINDGNLVLKVYYSLPVSEKDCMYITREGSDFILNTERNSSQCFGYKFLRTWATTAVISVKVPKSLIDEGGSRPVGGITFTNGNVSTEPVLQRPAGSYISMDFGLHVKGLKSYNNLYTMKGRAADVNTWAAQSVYYYDQVNLDNAPKINDKDRILSIVLYNGLFYTYIDDQFIYAFSPTNTNFFPAGFSKTDTYRFGIFIGCFATIRTTVTLLKEVYASDAMTEINTNARYSNIVNG